MKPFYGYVWFEGSDVRRAAAIYGTTNGGAVCMMEVPDAKAILKSGGMTNIRTRKNSIIVHDPSMGEDFRLPVVGNEVFFYGGWSLLCEEARGLGDPAPLRAAWRKIANFD